MPHCRVIQLGGYVDQPRSWSCKLDCHLQDTYRFTDQEWDGDMDFFSKFLLVTHITRSPLLNFLLREIVPPL